MMSITSFHLPPRGSLGQGPGLLGSTIHVNSTFAFGNFISLSPAEIPCPPLQSRCCATVLFKQKMETKVNGSRGKIL